ncbi:hypothetical protein BDQ12DRAFT_528131 [Crucibulum laeve]|uniref:DUF6533 domain-containing protein n=1 Tax=Crucibulum laeve TaxID=68775 RepID=A0A5C3LJJ9_9AGAR|nr:hypothetical protein BDQ12DRAFT_528131 [Crucibulum laeve]
MTSWHLMFEGSGEEIWGLRWTPWRYFPMCISITIHILSVDDLPKSAIMSAVSLLAPLYTALREGQQANCSHVAVLSILVYDTLLNFSREVEHIWSAKWSLPKILYIWARYYGPVHVAVTLAVTTRLNMPAAVNVERICGGCPWVVQSHSQRSVTVLYFLCTLLIGEFAAELYICVKIALITTKNVFPAPFGLPLRGCLTEAETTFTLYAWIPCLLVATTFFLMTLWKFLGSPKIKDIKEWRFSTRGAFSPLVMSFFRDGTIFFLLIAVTLLYSSVFVLLVKGRLQEIQIPWLISVYSFAGSRLILNLREVAAKGSNDANAGHSSGWDESLSLRAIPKAPLQWAQSKYTNTSGTASSMYTYPY